MGHYKCRGCAPFKYALELKEFTHPKGLGTFCLSRFLNCLTENPVYNILRACKHVYVGSSKGAIKTRKHCSRKNNKVPEASLTEHFLSNKHPVKDLRFLLS